MNRQEAATEFAKHRMAFDERGLHLPASVNTFVPDEWKRNANTAMADLAMDAGAGVLVTDPNSAIPAMLTTSIDPKVVRVVFTPLTMAKALGGEVKSGDWLDETRLFPIIEETGEVSSYDDYSNNGRTGVNFNYPAFQSYLFQTIVMYGEREAARAGLMKINYVGELTTAAADLLARYQNLTYIYGVSGIQNYGMINNPYIGAFLTPAVKAAGGTAWFNGNTPVATATEIYNDVLAVVSQIIQNSNGAVDSQSSMTLLLPPQSSLALTVTNAFGVSVEDLLKKNYPNIKIVIVPQYGVRTATNNQGFSTAGNVMQLIVNDIAGDPVAYPAFNEKFRAHKLIAKLSSWEQKYTAGSWGTILRFPFATAGMIGI